MIINPAGAIVYTLNDVVFDTRYFPSYKDN
jgi:hypothetical protein